MVVEVEAKIVLPSCSVFEDVVDGLRRIGGRLVYDCVEEDYYLVHPCRDFASSDEALRVRCSCGRWELTYKGPRSVVGGVKSRVEVSVGVSDGSRLLDVLGRLGFRVFCVVRKHRRCFEAGCVRVFLDRVEGLGCFVEVECVGGCGDSVECVRRVVRVLGLEGYESTSKSYLEMVWEAGLCRG